MVCVNWVVGKEGTHLLVVWINRSSDRRNLVAFGLVDSLLEFVNSLLKMLLVFVTMHFLFVIAILIYVPIKFGQEYVHKNRTLMIKGFL